MRHLVSILLGLILGFVIYVLLGYAAFKVQVEAGWSGDNAVGILALLAAGAAYAVLVVPRLSPLGPALVGFAYLGLGLWLVSDLSSFVDTMPNDLILENTGFGPGVYLLPLSIPLLATLVSPNRWMGRPRPAMVGAPAGPPPAYAPPPPEQQQFDSPYAGQPAGYGGAPPIGAPYSGPPSYDSPPQYGPGSPVGYPEQGQYGGQQQYPQDPMRPDITRRIQ